MDSFIEVIRSVIAILFTFSVSIFVHELGHFMFAKMFGVRVDNVFDRFREVALEP